MPDRQSGMNPSKIKNDTVFTFIQILTSKQTNKVMSDPNGVMMQYFHWYNPDDGSLWNQVAEKASELAAAGITALWLPPAYKGTAGWINCRYINY